VKRKLDLERAADAEAFGALAVRRAMHRRRGRVGQSPFTSAQRRALSDLAGSLVQIAKEVGAAGKRVTVGKVSFELQENGAEKILSIRKVGAS